jgi:hypothetical protein
MFPCLALPGRIKISYLEAKIGSYPSSVSSFCLVLPCVVWSFSLRLFVRFVTALRAFGHPSCQLASRCICVPLLPTRLALPVLFVRLAAHLANSPCLSLGRPTLAMPYKKIYLQAKIGSYPSSGSPFCLVLPCVVVFVTTLRVFGRPSCLLALRCVWVPLLPTRLALPLVAQPWPCRIKKSTSKPKLVLIRPPARLFS